ncbi:MAG: Hsp70 family protein [Saprospiraceae bacterium]|nr:Hsp70 family protein [Candidatus Brachybacter algidus]MBL0120640.1 Hsp70 family protein [Candidatus Brachybacter algidus]
MDSIRNIRKSKNIAVYDLGGSTFDLSVLTFGRTASSKYYRPKVIPETGGDDIVEELFCSLSQQNFK